MQKKIIILVVGLLLLGLGYYYKAEINSVFEKDKTQISRQDNPPTTSILGITSSSTGNDCTPPIKSQMVEEGKLMGVVEVGASGFNAFVIRINKQNDYEVTYKEFGESLAYEGFATYEDVKTGLRKYLSKIFEKGVSGNNMHFVMSSGALKNPKTKLIAESIKKLGYVVNEVTAEQEGKYALIALLPNAYKDNSFIVDIGSGNTKISYIQNGKIQTYETFGAKYYQIQGLEDTTVAKEVSTYASKVPSQYRENMFIIGGSAFKFAKQVCDQNRYVLLNKPDEYKLTNDDAKWNAGVNIYKSIYNTLQPKQVIFDYDANFTLGFLISLNK